MPPKKALSGNNFSISSTSSRIRSNVAADLITKSEAALSSQASVYTQRTNASQQGQMMNFGMGENEDIQFNRDEIGQVFITQEEQEVIQKILQLARKGKVNSKNAFDIPIKVVHSEANTSINNKFWKFASQLLDASMYIYDKRVENMYVSIGAFQNKLSRIGFNIKDKKAQQQERMDDVNAQEEMRRSKNREQRQMMLKISADDFSGSLNLDNNEIIGFQSIQRKDKLDIKNIENKFIADPTFQKTQKLFDSFSLKSLMLNIFNLSTDLNVGLFHNSDLNQQNKNYYESNEKYISEDMFKKQRSGSQKLSNELIQINKQTQSQNLQSQQTQSIQNNQRQLQQRNDSNNKAYVDQNNGSLSYELEKHLLITKNIIKQKPLLQEITNFISKQPQLKQDYFQRQNKLKTRRNSEILISDEQITQKNTDLNFDEIIQKQRIEFIQLFKEFQQNLQQEFGNRDNNDFNNFSGLYETHQTQSQNFQQSQSQSNFIKSFDNPALQEYFETNSMPVSIQESFFSWDEQNNIIEPIMPWQIEFKNLKLTKKRKKPQKGQSKRSKKSNKQSSTSTVDFGLQILDRQETLKNKEVKKKFETTRSPKRKFYQTNTQPKEFDIAHSEYHMRTLNHSRLGMTGIAQRQSFRKSTTIVQSQPIPQNPPSFVFDLDESVHPQFENMKKQENPGVSQEETRLCYGQSYSQAQEGGFFHSSQSVSKGLSYFGHNMGVNNIREIKKIIVNEVNEKGWTSLEQMNKLMGVLSPQQLFTIFLHLTNEHQLLISNQDGDESTIILSQARRQMPSNQGGDFKRRNNGRDEQIQI